MVMWRCGEVIFSKAACHLGTHMKNMKEGTKSPITWPSFSNTNNVTILQPNRESHALYRGRVVVVALLYHIHDYIWHISFLPISVGKHSISRRNKWNSAYSRKVFEVEMFKVTVTIDCCRAYLRGLGMLFPFVVMLKSSRKILQSLSLMSEIDMISKDSLTQKCNQK